MSSSGRLGEEHEQIVRDYLAHPTQEGRDQIVEFCTRIIKTMYGRYLRSVMLYNDFYQEAVCKLLEVLSRFKPDRGSFVNWALVSIDGFAKAIRFRTNRHFGVHQYIGLAPSEEPTWDVFHEQEENTLKSLDTGYVHRAICQVTSRFTTVREVQLLRYIYIYLMECGTFPEFGHLVGVKKFAETFALRELYWYRKYAIVECRLHLRAMAS